MEWLHTGMSLSALIILEIILGIDNLVFLSILTQRLPLNQQKKARQLGLTFAWMTRLLLLASAVWLVKLTTPLITLFDYALSARDIFLLLGGGFLIAKATQEIHLEVDEEDDVKAIEFKKNTLLNVVIQIAIMDIIFSLDSVLTAVGLTDKFWVMALAISIAIIVMIYASESVSHFIKKYPTIKMLALSFLILIGMILVADGLHFHVPRGYLYFAMGFSLAVEGLNLVKRSRTKKGHKK